MSIYKHPMWEEYNNPDTLVPWNFTEYIIYPTKNSPQDDYLVLRIIYEPYPNEYDYDEETQGDKKSIFLNGAG